MAYSDLIIMVGYNDCDNFTPIALKLHTDILIFRKFWYYADLCYVLLQNNAMDPEPLSDDD